MCIQYKHRNEWTCIYNHNHVTMLVDACGFSGRFVLEGNINLTNQYGNTTSWTRVNYPTY